MIHVQQIMLSGLYNDFIEAIHFSIKYIDLLSLLEGIVISKILKLKSNCSLNL